MLFITCPLWLVSVLTNECKRLGYKPFDQFSTWLRAEWSIHDCINLNLRSRIASKVYYQINETTDVTSFDELFERIAAQDRNHYLQPSHQISVSLFGSTEFVQSTRAAQWIIHKAILSNREWASPQKKTHETHTIDIRIHFDHGATKLLINTSGASLHQRWYRKQTGDAPLKENVAAWILHLMGRRHSQPLRDPFCGSGTIAIEAAMIARNIAPGIHRKRSYEQLPCADLEKVHEAKEAAQQKAQQFADKSYEITGTDNDSQVISMAQENAKRAWVTDSLHFARADATHDVSIQKFSWTDTTIVTNPPYGKRLAPAWLDTLYQSIITTIQTTAKTGGIITTYELPIPIASRPQRKSHELRNGADSCMFWRHIA